MTSSPPLTFGNYNPLSMVAHDAQTSVSVRCTRAGQQQLLVNMGPGLAGTVGQRLMQRGAARLAYGVYTDASRTTLWGDGTDGTTVVQKKVTPNSNSTFQIYGRIQPRQNASPGAYNDSVTVRLDF